MSEQAEAVPPSPTHSRKRLLWGMLLGALALAVASSVAWKPVHLAWCRHLIDSGEEWTQTRGLDRLGKVHIRKGANRAKVERVLASVGLVMRHAPEQSYGKMDRYVIGFADPEHPRFMFWALVQIEDGRFVGISTCH